MTPSKNKPESIDWAKIEEIRQKLVAAGPVNFVEDATIPAHASKATTIGAILNAMMRPVQVQEHYDFPELALAEEKKNFDAGDGDAVSRAYRICRQSKLDIPAWIASALDVEMDERIGLHAKAPRKSTPYARNGEALRARRHKALLVFSAVEAARQFPVTLEEAFILANKTLEHDFGIHLTPESISKTYYRIKTKHPPTADENDWLLDCGPSTYEINGFRSVKGQT